MIEITEKSRCSGCLACANICPKQCITMENDTEGFWYPKVNLDDCINCNLCEKACPIIHPQKQEISDYPTAYAAFNKDDEVRLKSSSGGIFALLAESIIADGGVVFGAAFTDDCRSVRHIAVSSVKDLEKLRGSKYLQSCIGDTYKEVKFHLNVGKPVLFTGTPCQIGGLKAYLDKEYDNLYTQDIICHGVPSPFIWKKYVEYREAKAASTTRRAFFREKKFSWKNYSVKLEFANSTEYTQNRGKDLYMRGFLSDLFLRPSCYDCAFKGINRNSDITLADFWGMQNVMPEMDDDRGTSLVLVQSEKGQRLFDRARDSLFCQEVAVEQAVQYNTAAVQSCQIPKKRIKFMDSIHKDPINVVLKKYSAPTLPEKIKSRIVRLTKVLLNQ